MRLPRIRFRIRTLLLIVAISGLAFAGVRIYQDGAQTHWLILKMRYGNVAARREAARDAWESERREFALMLLNSKLPGAAGNWTAEADRGRRRRSQLLIPVLLSAAQDSDAGCRSNAISSLSALATLFAPESDQRLVLRQILASTRDQDERVRATAMGSLAELARWDSVGALEAVRSGLDDSSILVRRAAARELGMLGARLPQTQSEVSSLLIPLLSGSDDSSVRVQAAWALCVFGRDHTRLRSGDSPDVVAALLAALSDSEVEVRRTVATILGASVPGPQGKTISAWDARRASIRPALQAALSYGDKIVREESALALFVFGRRGQEILELIQQGARDLDRTRTGRFESALAEWAAKPERNTATGRNESPRDLWDE